MRQHIEQRVKQSQLEMLPFPYLIIEDFFPASVYDEIIKHNLFKETPGEVWISRKASEELKSATPYDHRMQVNFTKGMSLAEFSEEKRSVWLQIVRTFLDDNWFPRLLYEKFPAYFLLRFGAAVNTDSFWNECGKLLFLQRHKPNFALGPHTDIPTRIFTGIFAFAETTGYEEFGTRLLRPKDPKDRCWGYAHHGAEKFELDRLAPYKPNNCLLFFKTRQSFHSVTTITESVPNQRFGMQFQYVEPRSGYFNDLSAPDLMAGRQKPSLRRFFAESLTKARRMI